VVNTIGFKEFEAKMKNLPKHLEEELDQEVFDSIKYWEQLAKESAPVDKGALQQNIFGAPTKKLTAVLTSRMEYSPYAEWGTGTRVKVPSELQPYAIQFKGVRETIGRFPKPFFFVHKPIVEKTLFNNVLKILSTPR
jgi:hypothetical protein